MNYKDNSVDFLPPSMAVTIKNIHHMPFLFLQDHRKDYKTMVNDALGNNDQPTELSRLFFSVKNMNLIQTLLKNAVKYKTKGKVLIEDQDEKDLLVIMRTIYYEYARKLQHSIGKQIFELNSIVVRETLPGILTNVKQYMLYIRDISRPIEPLDRPLNVSNAGRKTLPSVSKTF